MPVPNTKLYLSTVLSSAGGYSFLPNATGDFTATLTGDPIAPWAAGITDLNGDLRPDLIIGAAGDDDKTTDAGRVFVELGAVTDGSTTTTGSATQIIIDGVNAGDMAGASVGFISDLNAIGKAEILIGATGVDNGALADAGAAYVVWGKSTTGGIDLADVASGSGNGKGFIIKGQAAGDHAGAVVTSITDLNGNGKNEIIVGAPDNDAGGTDAGAVYVVWGKSTESAVNLSSVAGGTGGFRIFGESKNDHAGSAIGTTADMNGDGKEDILVGAYGNEAGGVDAGAAYVVFGKSTGAGVNLDNVALGTGGFRITGSAGEKLGGAIHGLGDINGDGRGDLMVSAAGADKAYVVFGKATGSEVTTADLDTGVGGFSIIAENSGDLSQMSIAGSADFNHDGLQDLVIGAPTNEEGGKDAGAVYVVWGGSTGPIDLSLVSQGIGGAKIVGNYGSLTGSTVSILPDMNGDGTPDLLIGSAGLGQERVSVLYTPTSWQPDTNVYGTNGDDVMDIGYGGLYKISEGNDTVLGLDGNDIISTGAGNDRIEGGTGADTMAGGTGDDTYVVDNASDVVIENAGEGTDTLETAINFTLASGVDVENIMATGFAQTLAGNELNNTLTGTAGNDSLDGGAGEDTLIGGAGNDTYYVDNAGDIVTEATSAGTDTVIASLDWTLGANLEKLQLTGDAHHGTGNALANTLTGTSGDDVLDGAAGNDTLIGGMGNDTYYVDSVGDVVQEAAGAGTDRVISSVNITSLAANVEELQLTGAARSGTGNALDNTLIGTDGNDTLNGAAGADTMIGGLGDDTYYVDNAGDVIVETADSGAGTDTIIANFDYVLGANVDNLTLTGAARHATGNALDNTLTGTSAADFIDGGAGTDTLVGGLGDDTYYVDSSSDVVVEMASAGKDTVIASADFTLSANVENLTLVGDAHSGTGNALDNVLTGGAGADTLMGLDGNDTLDGGADADILIGGLGDDTYYVDNMSDVVVEEVGGGNDTVVTSLDWTMSAGSNIEYVRLTGSAHTLIGNELDNRLGGSDGDDRLDGGDGDDTELGGDGDDTLVSGSGHDLLSGGSGDDTYELHGGSAYIEDFLGHDTLDASKATGNSHIDLSGEVESEVEGQQCRIGTPGSTAMPLDVQFLQDLSGSFGDDITTVRGLIPNIVAAVQAVQANSQFGSSSFVDKPISPFGASGEWVYKTELALTNNTTALTTTYSNMVIRYGADEPESQIEALMQLAKHSAEVGFRADSARFVVLFTDAPFHQAGDGAAAGITTPNNGDAVMDGGGIGEDYPLVSQLKDALVAANIIPIFAIANGYESNYQSLVSSLGRGTVVTLTSDSSNVVAAITTGLSTATTTTIEDAVGGSGDDTITGNLADNLLNGNAGQDTLDGKAGHDTLKGGAGQDVLVYDAEDTEQEGGDDSDTLQVATGGTFDLSAADQSIGDTALVHGIENIDGTTSTAALILTGSAVANKLLGGSGDDVMSGGAGNDTLSGRNGNDTLDGGLGRDTLNGGNGNDTIVYDTADAFQDGSYGSDTLVVATGGTFDLSQTTDQSLADTVTVRGFENVTAVTSTAAVTLMGSAGTNKLSGGAGNDTLSGFAGNDTLSGGNGNDVLDGGLGRDTINGGNGNDTIIYDAGDGYVDASYGTDTLLVSTGGVFDFSQTSDQSIGDAANLRGFEYLDATTSTTSITFTGSTGTNKVTGGSADDVMHGGDGNDTLSGKEGNDTLAGDAGNDTLSGGNGNDTLIAGTGQDLLTGGAGNDSFVFTQVGAGLATVTDFSVAAATADHLDLTLLFAATHPTLMDGSVLATDTATGTMLSVDTASTGVYTDLAFLKGLHGQTAQSLYDHGLLLV